MGSSRQASERRARGASSDQKVAKATDEERQMMTLEKIAASLEGGSLEGSPRVRNTLASPAERETAGRPRRAGQTQVGLSVPENSVAGPLLSSGQAGRGAALSAAQKAVVAVEARIGRVLSTVAEGDERLHGEMELLWLVRTLYTLRSQADCLPADVVLSESLDEYVDEVHATLADFQDGGIKAARRLASLARQLACEVTALGGTVDKMAILSLRDALAETMDLPADSKLLAKLYASVLALTRQLERLSPRVARTMLDELMHRLRR